MKNDSNLLKAEQNYPTSLTTSADRERKMTTSRLSPSINNIFTFLIVIFDYGPFLTF